MPHMHLQCLQSAQMQNVHIIYSLWWYKTTSMCNENRALPQYLFLPVGDDCRAICAVGQEEGPDSKVILHSPMIGLWGPVVEFSNKSNSLRYGNALISASDSYGALSVTPLS